MTTPESKRAVNSLFRIMASAMSVTLERERGETQAGGTNTQKYKVYTREERG